MAPCPALCYDDEDDNDEVYILDAQAIEEPFLLAVRETLNVRFSRRVETLFKKTIRYILTLIVIGFQQTRRRSSQYVSCHSSYVTRQTSPPVTRSATCRRHVIFTVAVSSRTQHQTQCHQSQH